MSSCIFHLPLQIDSNRASASQIRPQKMLRAFRSIGYDVAVVAGRAAERRAQGDEIKRRIREGERFDFLYSESSTMPTQLTEPNHFPVSRKIDFGFMEFCKEHGIPIGLFYRDIYWKFPAYRNIGRMKSALAIHYYKRDLKEYARLLDVLYMPTSTAFKAIEKEAIGLRRELLPPGCDISEDALVARIAKLGRYASVGMNAVKLLYVGGIGQHYGFDVLIDALHGLNDVEATFCVRKDDYARYPRAGELAAMSNVRIVHASGQELESLYHCSDVALICFDANPYQKLAMPFKTFEYIAHGLPIVSNGGTEAADFVRESGVGWVADGDASTLAALLRKIAADRSKIADTSLRCIEIAQRNTWEERARSVARMLSE